MFPRVLPFLLALVLLFAGTLAKSHVAPVSAGNTQAAQELVAGDDERSGEVQVQADGDRLLDIPDLLLGTLAVPAAVVQRPGLHPHTAADRAAPYLKGPLRPPSGSGLPA